MTKGRRATPSSANEGIWFRHRGEAGDIEGRFRDSTSTRDMQNAPFSAPARIRQPPSVFKDRDRFDYKTANPFTQHDNRHHFQDRGEYLGNGDDTRQLGRRLHSVDLRLHHTDERYLYHHSREPVRHDYNPVTAATYRHPQVTDTITRRRFPRIFRNAESDMCTEHVSWPPSLHITPLRVLAVSQQPFPGHNSWKYSYKGLHRVYPTYDRRPSPRVDNILNRYGADFTARPEVELKE